MEIKQDETPCTSTLGTAESKKMKNVSSGVVTIL